MTTEQWEPWGRCPCGDLWMQHDVEEHRGDGTEMCCVEGCDQISCPGRKGALVKRQVTNRLDRITAGMSPAGLRAWLRNKAYEQLKRPGGAQ